MLWRQARQIVFTLELLRRRKQQPSSLNLFILVPAARARRFLRRVPVATREVNAERRSLLWRIGQRLADLPLEPSIASAATNTCCGGKRDRLCLRWSWRRKRGGVAGGIAGKPFFAYRDDVL